MMVTKRISTKASDWGLDTGYNQNSPEKVYPNIAPDAGQNNGLELTLSSREYDREFMCGDLYQGFFISLRLPGEGAWEEQVYSLLDLSENIRIPIEPKLHDISKGLSRYKPEQRQCFFNFERPLHFFKIFTIRNCMYECLINITRQQCGCILFSMPSKLLVHICIRYKVIFITFFL